MTEEWVEPTDAELEDIELELEELEAEIEADPLGVKSILDAQEKYEDVPYSFGESFSITGMRIA